MRQYRWEHQTAQGVDLKTYDRLGNLNPFRTLLIYPEKGGGYAIFFVHVQSRDIRENYLISIR